MSPFEWIILILVVLLFWRAIVWGAGLLIGVFFGLMVILFLFGCTSTPRTFEETYNRQTDMENWQTCVAIYEAHGKPTFHQGHSHTNGRQRQAWVWQDLMSNNCRQLLKSGGLWAEHI